MSAEEEIMQFSARYDPATPQPNKNSALQQQYIKRDLALLIRSVIRDNIDEAVINSFQPLSLGSANERDA